MTIRWTLKKTFIFFIGSTCVTFCLSVGGYWIYNRYQQLRLQDDAFYIAAIIQTGPEKEALKTEHLAEILDLSVDTPTSLFAFDCTQAAKKLASSPFIANASVKKMPPQTLYIDYEVRKPVAYLADYKNIAIDCDGYIFPFAPFFSPKEIPEIYLGLPPFAASEDSMGRSGACWLSPVKNRYFQLACEVLQFLEEVPWKERFCVKRIDVSNAFALSLGQREIVIFTEELCSVRNQENEVCCVFPKILRLASKDFSQQLTHFFALRKNMEEDYRKQLSGCLVSSRFQPRIIDLRIPQLAFVQK